MARSTTAHIVTASFKRAQEAARVIEEYTKITDTPHLSDIAKHLRFSLYSIEKEWKGNVSHG
jgi:thiamine-phosphate pyrophosphorylase